MEWKGISMLFWSMSPVSDLLLCDNASCSRADPTRLLRLRSIPAAAEQQLVAQLNNLSAAQLDVLACGAVIGDTFDLHKLLKLYSALYPHRDDVQLAENLLHLRRANLFSLVSKVKAWS